MHCSKYLHKSPYCTPIHTLRLAPLINCVINDALLETINRAKDVRKLSEITSW